MTNESFDKIESLIVEKSVFMTTEQIERLTRALEVELMERHYAGMDIEYIELEECA